EREVSSLVKAEGVLDGQVAQLLELCAKPLDARGLAPLRCAVENAIEFLLHHRQQVLRVPRVWRHVKDLVRAVGLNGAVGMKLFVLPGMSVHSRVLQSTSLVFSRGCWVTSGVAPPPDEKPRIRRAPRSRPRDRAPPSGAHGRSAS